MNKKRGRILVVLGLLVFVALFSQSLADVAGCYVYPEASEDLYCQENILDTEAQLDCDFFDSCNMAEHFIPASDCSELDECQEVVCNADCQTHALGICTQLGGIEVPDNQFDFWCSPGCCNIESKDFCQFNLYRFECNDKAKKLGALEQPSFTSDTTFDECNQNICEVTLEKATLTVIVEDDQQKAISGAKISLTGTNIESFTDGNGQAVLPLNLGTYSLIISADGYAAGSLFVSLSSGEIVEETVTLQKVDNVAQISGVVEKLSGPLEGATVSWSGPVFGQTFTDNEGKYETVQLPKGDYVFTASKVGYKAQEEKYKIETEGLLTLNFQLTPIEVLGISGIVYLDSNPNKVIDADDKVVYGATIYLDGVFKGYSKYDKGDFNIPVEVTSENGEFHNVSAVYQNYQYKKEFFFEPGKSINELLLLTTYIGVCSEPGSGQAVEEFSVTPVTGEKVMKVEWEKPCQEVTAYKIIKSYTEGEEIVEEEIDASNEDTFILDGEVEWDQEYTYTIVTYYDTEFKSSETEITKTVGSKHCEDKYNSETGKWNSFCLIGDEEIRKTIWTCDKDNQLKVSNNCGGVLSLGEDYYCAQNTETSADCQNAGTCGLLPQQADPFGLYYDREKCYGTTTPETGTVNYCYFDYSNTTFDQCSECKLFESCFDYKSKDACQVNNCLSTKCNWINDAEDTELVDYSLIDLPLFTTFTTPETGTGYCVEEDYEETPLDLQGDDYCSLCDPLANLFENNYCTAEVCSGLGRCFSEFNLEQCSSCGEFPNTQSNCYGYNTELECVGQQSVQRDPYGNIIDSNDECSWNRCLWTGTSGGHSENGCVKDGNGDSVSDCEFFASDTDKSKCRLDNSPPKTIVLPEGINVISSATPEIFFMADDGSQIHFDQENFLGTANYCLTSIVFDNCFDKDNEKAFIGIPYPGNSITESVTLNLFESPFLQGKEINGETYRLKYYSEDKYLNQESVRETFVFVDNVVPEFEINQDVNTVEDVTTLSVYLTGTKEIMGCTFTLEQILPVGDDKVITIPREEEIKIALFENLKSVKSSLNVTCVDDAGNQNSKVKDYVFDLEERIDIISPEMESALSETELVFEVNTVAGASCGLYLTVNNEKIADFISDEEGKVHKTEPVPGFFEKEYAGEHKVVCSELLGLAETYEDYFSFVIDFSPPETQIILREGNREEKPTAFGWEESFIENVLVDFECSATGFACDKTYYCLGDDCQANFFTAGKENYQEYTASIELLESSAVCYYSIDLANNPVYQPLCGEIIIEGYGITLEKPERYIYQKEQWGISNEPVFDFQFFTKVPTTECRIDFSSEFDYESLPTHKIKEINADKKYLFKNFPESVFTSYPESCSGDDADCIKTVYVKCKDLNGEVGPETKIYLEYDAIVPEIIDAFADPDEVFEGITTELFVNTDDKTLCRFSDNSEGTGSQEYGNMEYSFPGTEEKILNLNHQTIFNINFIGPTKKYNLYTQCANGAEELSLTEEILFSVDYSQVGYFVEGSFSPSGFVSGENVTISVETSKNAFCKYDFDSQGYKPFNSDNQRLHTAEISVSEEGDYIIPVKCVMGDHTVSGEIKFTYDLSPPVITKIEDGNYSCGSEEIELIVNTNESGTMSKYIYEVYNKGKDLKVMETKKSSLIPTKFVTSLNINSSSSEENESESEPVDVQKVGAMVLNGELGSGLPLTISTERLLLGNLYTIKVKAVDAAGNEGKFAESDGIAIVNKSYPVCLEKKSPVVLFALSNSSCSAIEVEMTCQDNTGCKNHSYGVSGTEKLCNATKFYNGEKISFNKNGWICYSVNDLDSESKGKKQITFMDKDGDKILDACDQCPETAAGKLVNNIGCADGEVPQKDSEEDTDGDGLPDIWEKSYDTLTCPLSYVSQDTDNNGITDSQEDYDGDEINNYQEYLLGNNPCLADKISDVDTKYTTDAVDEEGVDVLAWIFFILGLLMIFGGTGYLVYYYIYSSAGKTVVPPVSTTRVVPSGIIGTKPKVSNDLKDKLSQLKKYRQEKLKLSKRRGLFGRFSSKSKNIPHLERFIQKKSPNLSHLDSMAQKYSEHKDEIKPGLKAGEKSIFNKLENIAKQTKNKKIHQVVKKSEANEIFSKLKKISKKRKGK